MTDLRKAAEMALDALHNIDQSNNYDAIEALRQALAQPEQEPVAWGFRRIIDGVILDIKNSDEHEGYEETYTVPLYTAPPKREWVGLTDEEARDISFNLPIKWTGHLQGAASIYDFARAIEAKLKEKNT